MTQQLKKMANLIFLIFVGFLSTAKLADAICCESIKSVVEKKMEANETLCAAGSALPANCCKDIANEVEKHVTAYKTLCSKGAPASCPASKALGMESGEIPDNAITASSFHDNYHKPSYARLNTNTGHCSWTPTSKGKSNSWLQVDLGQLTTVTAIATQGSCIEDQWATSYAVSYSADNNKWRFFQVSGNNKAFQANTDKTSIVKNSFELPVRARYMRVWPQSWNTSLPEMRVEFYGCV